VGIGQVELDQVGIGQVGIGLVGIDQVGIVYKHLNFSTQITIMA
jgi:hypothetical protein